MNYLLFCKNPDGREISFSYEWEKDKNGEYIINKNGGYNLIGVTMNVISFSGQDDNSITFSTKVNLSVANSMNIYITYVIRQQVH